MNADATYWSGNGVTAKKVTAQLRAIGDRPVEVQINSPGGDMFEGIAIFNVLREHSQPVTVKIMGYAASAASLIAMAGDRIEIGASCFVMIHNAWVLTAGNRHALVETAEWLTPFDQAMVDLYVSRTGQKPTDIVKWMDAETYMSGSVAIERGFANALLAADTMKIDEETKARDRSVSELRALELQLVAGGATRADARERVSRVRGLSGLGGGSPSGERDSWSGLDGLLSALRA